MFRTTTLAAALLFAATPMVLTSCSKSPIQKATSLIDEATEILNDTTADNIDKQIAKMDALMSDAKKVGEAYLKMAKETSKEDRNNEELKKQGMEMLLAGDKCAKAENALRKRVGSVEAAELIGKARKLTGLVIGR